MKSDLQRTIMFISKSTLQLIVLQLIGIQLLMANESEAQMLKDVRISLKIENASLVEIFELIEEKTDFKFGYNRSVSNLELKLSTKFANEGLDKILLHIGKKADLHFKRINKSVSVIVSQENDDSNLRIVEVDREITGKITDAETGEALVGATVQVKGTTIGTVTDLDGNFTLSIPDDAETLLISYVGFQTTEISIGAQSSFDITLASDADTLGEVVVVGYGVQKKANLTGAVASVKGDVINQRPITQGSQALQGLAPGVYVNTNSGEPGNDDASIIIRGVGTLNDAKPLVLVDGIEAPLNSINTNDIESINILKDAASASIYGTRAANGVILITTKRGVVGKPTISYNASYGITSPTVVPETVTDTKLYLETYVKAAERTSRAHSFTPDLISEIVKDVGSTDWVGDYLNNGSIQNHDISISGGTDAIKYRWSGSYLDQQSYLEGDWYLKRLNTRLNLDISVSDKVKIGTSMAFANSNNRQAPKNDAPNTSTHRGITEGVVPNYGGKGNFLYQILLVNPPNQFVKDEFGRYGGSGAESSRSQRHNPQAIIDNQWVDIDGNEFYGNVFVEYEPLENLKIKYTTAINAQQESHQDIRLEHEQYDRFGNRTSVRESGSRLLARESAILNFTNWLQANYSKSIGDHNFNLLAGANQETSSIRRVGTFESGFGSTSLVRIGNGTVATDISNFNGEWVLQSFFGRVNYNYKNKYLLEVNVRRDGSSRFGNNSRWATFPGVSVGYALSEEDFWTVDFISYLKLRGSWGKLGVQSTNFYPYSSELTSGSDYNDNSGASLTKLGNENLAWEETKVSDFGVDLELLEGKISLEADYFIKTSTGILTDLDAPLTVGIDAPVTVNAASVENKGWDMALRTNNQIGDLKIRAGLNITHVTGKVLEINPDVTDEGDRLQIGYAQYWEVGEAPGAIRAHEFGGIFQEEDFNPDGSLVSGLDYSPLGSIAPRPGDIKYTDQNGDGVIDFKDRVVVGNTNPEWLYGLNLDFEYKAFDMGLFFQGVGETNSMVNRYTGNFGHSGLRKFWLNAWTPENRSNTVPAIFVDREGFNGYTIDQSGGFSGQNSFWVIDQTYLRLKNIVIGYTLPDQLLEKISVNYLRLYVSGQNLWTKSKLDDLDPERNAGANHFGATMPQQKVITFGLNLRF